MIQYSGDDQNIEKSPPFLKTLVTYIMGVAFFNAVFRGRSEPILKSSHFHRPTLGLITPLVHFVGLSHHASR